MSEFTAAIGRNWPDYIIATGTVHDCSECTNGEEVEEEDHETLQAYDEGGFSWSGCDSCGSTLGGLRYNAHAIHREAFGPDAKQPDNVHHINICADCLIFHANGAELETKE